MKLTWLLEVISTYKMYASEILSWWPKVRSISWPQHYKHTYVEVWKCFPFRISRPKPSNYFRITSTHPICDDLSATDDRGSRRGHLGSNEVKWGHKPFFANKSRQDGERDAQIVPNYLARLAASEYVHILTFMGHNLILTWPWPDLTRGKILKLTFQDQKYMFRAGSTSRTRWFHFYFCISISKTILMINHLREKW